MIYLDTSVALAHLLGEGRHPPDALWAEPIVASRLIEYELWNRLHARKLAGSHGESARILVGRIALLELVPPVIGRALDPFPVPVRTLDALHLAAMDFLVHQGVRVELATYDERMADAARRMHVPLSRHVES